ncbi:TonB-dependent receptor [uncultured Oxalicibacterium sp.]|uniref:TonB-dependent receptor n=1 Tax=uncultured Oxalicibacterium sp. TaxID=1168540 RepID=UPI0025DBA6E3|nr:TonB-dependent receptor [uncultured Oxalicibacterium sp.]
MTALGHPFIRRHTTTPSHPGKPTRIAVLLAFAFSGTPAFADDTNETKQTLPVVEVRGAQENSKLNLDTPSTTGSRLGLTPRETPATVTIVDRATIDARGADDTQEILKAIPGVTAHNAPGSIGVSYRGFNSGSLSQLYNGIDVKYTIASRAVDSWIYDRVEAIGGASSFLNGAGAIGGSINYITKLAQRQDISEGRIRLGTDNLKEASIGLNRHIAGGEEGSPAHYARIDLNHRDAGSWIDGTKTTSTQLATSLLSDLGRGLTHTLAYEYQNEQVDRPYWGTPLLKPTVGTLRIDEGTRFKNYNSADGEYAQRVQWLRSITDLQVNDALHFTNTFYAYDAQRDYRNVETYTFNTANTAVLRSGALLQRHDQRLVGNRIDGTYKSELGGKRSDWSFGLDVSLNKQTRFPNSLTGTVSTVNPYAFTTGNFFDETGLTPGYNPDRTNKITTVAAYLENRTALVPTLNLVTALRVERIDLDLINRRAVSASAPASYQRSYTPVTGRIGLVWDITPNAMAYVQYATAADPPAGSLSTASFANAITNTELTTGKQIEIGSKLDFWQGRGNAAIAAYSITRENFGVTDPTNSANTLLVGKQTSNGIDLSLGLELTRNWSMQGSFSYVDAYYNAFFDTASRAGNTPSGTPATVANLWTTYAFTSALKGSAGIRRVGKVYGNAANTTVWPHYTLLDLALSYQISPKVSLIGRIKNATDEIYAASVSANSVYLGAPRTADVTLRIAF